MFDPGSRSEVQQVEEMAEQLKSSRVFPDLLRFIPNILMVLNRHRQLIYLNRNPLHDDQETNGHKIGDRPGECMGCIHLIQGKNGCGSSDFCKVCGFNKALYSAENGKPAREECHIALTNGSSLTMHVTVHPFTLNGEPLYFCALEDISDKKRTQMLESIFLHDILNNAAILQGISETYDHLPKENVISMLREVSDGISEEVQSYRLISNAEAKTLRPKYELVDPGELASEIVRSLNNMKLFDNRIALVQHSTVAIVTDRTLLRRVLINMLKNALEAGKNGESVEMHTGYSNDSTGVVFTVKNQQVIPAADQLKLFQKSFSTKGKGRGWGTYSIKILTERYLGGKVGFDSQVGKGTTFSISIPSMENIPIR